ncbi:MAG TPA: DsbA family oxidoreductase [Burkholderiales bacterium]|jgi:predicted DsbA family dithiol-disulfide isomerase|nr:DsbA family oxidoreductase [Burkholderiales bacterium]
MNAAAKPLRIEVVSDVVCPWCYIGKRRLEKALALVEGSLAPQVTWLPFQLNPGMPAEGMPRAEYRRAKFGSLERGRQLDARVAAEGRSEGLEFALERIERTPNTFAAHQLIDLAQQEGAGGAVVDALFRAYFEEARDVGDRGVLLAIADSAGLARAQVEARWADAAEARRVAELEDGMKALGISGVPTFILERKFGVSGAQPAEALAAAMREAATT